MEKKIMKILCEISDFNEKQLNEKTPIRDAGINSFTIMQVFVKIEQEFGIEIDEKDLDFAKIITLEDLFRIVRKKVS